MEEVKIDVNVVGLDVDVEDALGRDCEAHGMRRVLEIEVIVVCDVKRVASLIRIKTKKTRDVEVGGHQWDRAERRTIDGIRERLAIRISIVTLGADVAVFITRVCKTDDTVAVDKAIVIVTVSVAVAGAFRAVDVLDAAVERGVITREARFTVLARKGALALTDKTNRERKAASVIVAFALVKLVPVVADDVVAVNKRGALGREETRKVDKEEVTLTRDDLLRKDLDLDGCVVGAVGDDVGTQKVAEETLQVNGVVEEDIVVQIRSRREGHRDGEGNAEEKVVEGIDACSRRRCDSDRVEIISRRERDAE